MQRFFKSLYTLMFGWESRSGPYGVRQGFDGAQTQLESKSAYLVRYVISTKRSAEDISASDAARSRAQTKILAWKLTRPLPSPPPKLPPPSVGRRIVPS